MTETASEFLWRLAADPRLRPMDHKMLRQVAEQVVKYAEWVRELQEENERLWRRLSNKGKPDIEVPF